jgi:hypothetical protein
MKAQCLDRRVNSVKNNDPSLADEVTAEESPKRPEKAEKPKRKKKPDDTGQGCLANRASCPHSENRKGDASCETSPHGSDLLKIWFEFQITASSYRNRLGLVSCPAFSLPPSSHPL